MGMYTELNGKIILNSGDFYNDSLAGIMINCVKRGGVYEDTAKNFINLPRWDMISVTNTSIVNWGDSRKWCIEIEADMKNYNGEIDTFLNEVLPLIAQDWEISVQYDEWIEPIISTKADGYDTSKAIWEDY